MNINHLIYADDLVVFSPSSVGLRELLSVCETDVLNHDIKFNYKKSAILIIRGKYIKNVCHLAFKFNKILTRFVIQAKGPDGKWARKPLAYRESNNVHLLITRPPEICVNLVFKHIHAASSYTICRQFVPFIYCPL